MPFAFEILYAVWYPGSFSYALTPPPLPDHALSAMSAPLDASSNDVPPTPITFGEDAGQLAPVPSSPDDAKNAAAGFALSTKCVSYESSSENSAPPQLIEIATTSLRDVA